MIDQRTRDFITKQMQEHDDPCVVTVFPIMCGLGKSSYIRYAIIDAISNNRGLIVVTDKIAGLKNYTSADEQEVDEYLSHNRDRIALLYNETVQDELPYLYGKNAKPVVLMTTQRYFKLSHNDIVRLTTSGVLRSKIIFDEKPFFTSMQKISVRELNTVDAALRDGIDDTANQTDKEWLITQWRSIAEGINTTFAEYEALNVDKPEKSYWQDPIGSMTDDDSKFWELIERYKKKLTRNNPNVYGIISATYQLFDQGATFTSCKWLSRKSKSREYGKYFTVTMDNSDKLLDIGAKVFVFDGTADVSPDYDLDYVELIDCSDFRRNLNNLTIRVVNTPTSKTSLTSKTGRKRVAAIGRYIHHQWTDPIVFTYAELEKQFKNAGFNTVGHFGNLKGSNLYRDQTEIVQVGMNRFPDSVYREMTYFHALHSTKDNNRMIVILGPNAVKKTMNRALIEDLEQNIFRSAIRDPNYTGRVAFTLISSAYAKASDGKTIYSEIVQMIKERYEKMGANVEVIDTPQDLIATKIENRNNRDDSHAQIILNWLRNHQGETFKAKQMLTDIGLTQKQFERAKERNSGLRNCFLKMAEADKRKGYYVAL